MPRLHLPRSSYDLLIYDFHFDFSASEAAISYDVCGYIAYDHLAIYFGDKLGDLTNIVGQPQGYRAVIVLSS